MKIGLIGIVDRELELDFFGAMARGAGIGYQGMELGLSNLERAPAPLPEVRQRLADLGLVTANIHILRDALDHRFAVTVGAAHPEPGLISCRGIFPD